MIKRTEKKIHDKSHQRQFCVPFPGGSQRHELLDFIKIFIRKGHLDERKEYGITELVSHHLSSFISSGNVSTDGKEEKSSRWFYKSHISFVFLSNSTSRALNTSERKIIYFSYFVDSGAETLILSPCNLAELSNCF